MSTPPMSPDDYATDDYGDASREEREVVPLTQIARPRFALRVSGARAGDAARPSASGAPAAGAPTAPSDPYAMPRRTARGTQAPRFGLRVHARFGVVPEAIVASDDEGGAA